MKTILLPIDLDETDSFEMTEAFGNYPQIKVVNTGDFDLYDPIFSLTSDEESLRKWVSEIYDSEMTDIDLDSLFGN
jgi:hypothetical protein